MNIWNGLLIFFAAVFYLVILLYVIDYFCCRLSCLKLSHDTTVVYVLHCDKLHKSPQRIFSPAVPFGSYRHQQKWRERGWDHSSRVSMASRRTPAVRSFDVLINFSSTAVKWLSEMDGGVSDPWPAPDPSLDAPLNTRNSHRSPTGDVFQHNGGSAEVYRQHLPEPWDGFTCSATAFKKSEQCLLHGWTKYDWTKKYTM